MKLGHLNHLGVATGRNRGHALFRERCGPRSRGLTVIARSVATSSAAALDCFASLALTIQIRLNHHAMDHPNHRTSVARQQLRLRC